MVVSWWNCEVRIWRVKKHQDPTEKPTMILRLALRGDENISSATISENGELLAASTASGVKVFQIVNPNESAASGLRVRKLEVPHLPSAKLVKFSADGKWLAAITQDDQALLARTTLSSANSERPRIVPRVFRLTRLQRSSGPHDALNTSRGSYDRSITHVEFSPDGAAFAVADLRGYIDTWVLDGDEDPTSDVDEIQSQKSDDDDSDDEADEALGHAIKIMGQRWIRNPSGHLLPRVDSTPLLISFEPLPRDERLLFDKEPVTRATKNTSQSQSSEPATAIEQRLLVVTAQHSIYEFEVLGGRLSEWTRRNPPSSYPPQFRGLDPVKGCIWDVENHSKRVWLYGDKWLFMFDLAQDLPLTEPTKANTPSSKKRKREVLKETPGKTSSGAGGAVPQKEQHITKMRRITGGEDDDASERKWIDLAAPAGPKMDDSSSDNHALTMLRRTKDNKGPLVNGHTVPEQLENGPNGSGSRDSSWHSYKYRPILGIVPIGKRTEPLEVVLVERPPWDLELPSKFVSNFE